MAAGFFSTVVGASQNASPKSAVFVGHADGAIGKSQAPSGPLGRANGAAYAA